MPLRSGKSKSAFKHNVEAEIAAGKPPKQAVAIAYSEQGEHKRRLVAHRKMSKGGYLPYKRAMNLSSSNIAKPHGPKEPIK